MNRLEGKVAFISGVARGQGRSHAVRLAEEGADIIGFDICDQIDTVPFPLATVDDLDETIKLVENVGRRIVARQADVRDLQAVRSVLEDGVSEFGRVDIVLCNAGSMFGFGLPEMSVDNLLRAWQDAIDVMLTGVLNTIVVALPALMSQGTGGSIVITSSTAGLKTLRGPAHTPEDALPGIGYTAAKTGVIGLMRSFAGSLAHLNIRVNSVHPTGVNTPFLINDFWARFFEEGAGASATWSNLLPVELVEPEDVSNAIVWLCSDEGRYITGVQLPVDAGFMLR
jgi:SDR family mycofactocin-dependent oxidoreductase